MSAKSVGERPWKLPEKIVVKVGGAILDDPAARTAFAKSVAACRESGSSLVIVHGGGAQISRLTEALGIVAQRVDGLRVTDAATALATVQALRGEVNSSLTAALVREGVRALGISGVDAGLIHATRVDQALGFVGKARSADSKVLRDLAGNGFTPVVATVADSPDGFLNINADAAVAAVAEAFSADAVLFLSDVEHVRGPGADGSGERIARIDPLSAKTLVQNDVIVGGMLPKVEAALEAATRCGPATVVKMASGLAEHPIESALGSNETGTTFQSAVALAKETHTRA